MVAVGLAVAAAGSSGAMIDLDRTGAGLAPFIGALAGLPFALIRTRPMLGWFVSAVSALVIAATLPLIDPDPWPWPIPHGLVLLALLGAVCARESLIRAVVAWLATAFLFAWGVPPDITAGWIVGVSSVAVIGLLAGRLARSNRRLVEQAELSEQEKTRRVVLEERKARPRSACLWWTIRQWSGRASPRSLPRNPRSTWSGTPPTARTP
ncbi:MAG: hypothetical protein ACRDTG_32960 [Pseudonocardiaceae bacterium]